MTVFVDTDQNTLWDTAGVTLVFMVDLKLSQTVWRLRCEVDMWKQKLAFNKKQTFNKAGETYKQKVGRH